MPAFLIVRLGALGDIVHGLPVAAALADSFPGARVDWLVDARHTILLSHVPVLTSRISVDTRRARGDTGVPAVVRLLRSRGYDAAFDLQGLIKSAVLARLSGSQAVIGFTRRHLREGLAETFYTQSIDPGGATHVIDRGLSLLRTVGVSTPARRFPLSVPASHVPAAARAALGLAADAPFAVLNPGAAWPNKRWPASRFGALASALRAQRGLRSIVMWGPGEEGLAGEVRVAAGGAAELAPPTTLPDALALVAGARLVVSGDTGPLHLAAAVGTPVVGIYGPTNPARNGPWDPADVTVSRSSQCACFHQRRCTAAGWCLLDVEVDEVVRAAVARLDGVDRRHVTLTDPLR